MFDNINNIKIIKPLFQNNIFNIKDFGGINDGKSDNTIVFKNAINDCHEKGGGKVIIPSGIWFTKAIHLKSNVNLFFEDNAVLTFSDEFSDYLPAVFVRWEGVECYNYSPLIYANGCENIAITGNGVIEGNGEKWWTWKVLQHAAVKELYHSEFNKIPPEDRIYGNEEEALRPYFIQFINCKNILLEGLTLKNGPMWTVSPVYCENVTISNLKIFTYGPNTDGINPESSRNLLIENCFFEVGDDCIAVNSGMNEDGWRVNKSCENIIIRNCTMKKGHAAVAFGSGVSGGIKNIFIYNCKFLGGWWGIRLKTMPGRGGFVKNIFFDDIEISNQERDAIQMTAFFPSSSAPSTSNAQSLFENINIKNIYGEKNKGTISLNGIPENYFKNIFLESINLSGENGFNARFIDGLNLENIRIKNQNKPDIILENAVNIKSKSLIIN